MFRRPSLATITVIGLILLGALLRIFRHNGWIPLPPNVAPISALAIFSGALLPRRYTFIVPLAAMLASDVLIGFYSLPIMVAVYASFAVSNLLGHWLRQRRTVSRIAGVSVLGSVLFFVVTNLAVWAFSAMYPHSLAGLSSAFAAGLPFFRNTALGDLGFTAVFFGIYQLVVVYSTRRAFFETLRASNG